MPSRRGSEGPFIGAPGTLWALGSMATLNLDSSFKPTLIDGGDSSLEAVEQFWCRRVGQGWSVDLHMGLADPTSGSANLLLVGAHMS